MPTTTTQEHVEAGHRFRLARGATMIAVWPADALTDSVPFDMMDIPDWINRSALDDEGFQMLCRLWLHRAAASPSPNRTISEIEANLKQIKAAINSATNRTQMVVLATQIEALEWVLGKEID